MPLCFLSDPQLLSEEIETADSSRFYVKILDISMIGRRVVLSRYFWISPTHIGFTVDQAEKLIVNLNDAICIARSTKVSSRAPHPLGEIFRRLFPKIIFERLTPIDYLGGELYVCVEENSHTYKNNITIRLDTGDAIPKIYLHAENAESLVYALERAIKVLRTNNDAM